MIHGQAQTHTLSCRNICACFDSAGYLWDDASLRLPAFLPCKRKQTESEGQWRCRKWGKECRLKPRRSPCVSPPSSRFFSSSIALILASWTSARAFHSPLFVFSPANIGLISEWNRENSCKDTHGTCAEHKWTQTDKKEGIACRHEDKCLELLSSYLVHEGADEVDETALHLWQLVCVISVHHRLKKSETVIIWWFCSNIQYKRQHIWEHRGLTIGCCSRTVLSRSPCSQNSAATIRATWKHGNQLMLANGRGLTMRRKARGPARTLLWISHGFVMADRSQAVIIIALCHRDTTNIFEWQTLHK